LLRNLAAISCATYYLCIVHNRRKNIEKIIQKLAELDSFIRLSNQTGRLDVNRYAQTLSRDLLNILYGYNLDNLDLTERPNFPVIDLGDATEGICFQVTSSKSPSELKTLVSRHAEIFADKYPKFYLFILSVDGSIRKKAITSTGLPEDQILDFVNIIRTIENLQPESVLPDKILKILYDNHFDFTYVEDALTSYRNNAKERFDNDVRKYVSPLLVNASNYQEFHHNDDAEDFFVGSSRVSHNEKVILDDVIKSSRRVIISGSPGSGKTEALRHLFTKFIEHELVVPIFLDLSERIATDKIVDLIKKELRKYITGLGGKSDSEIADLLVDNLLLTGRLFLIFDSYDELHDSDLVAWNEKLRTFLASNSDTMIALGVRKNRIPADIRMLIKEEFEILPFDEKQIKEFILLNAEDEAPSEAVIKQAIDLIKHSKPYFSSPAMVIKMIVSYGLATHKVDSYKSTALIYQDYFDHLLQKKLCSIGLDNSGSRMPELYEELSKEYSKSLSIIAMFLFQNRESGFPTNFATLNFILRKIDKCNPSGYVCKKGLDFFTEEIPILKRKDNRIHFVHATFQEFFIGAGFKDNLFIPESKIMPWIYSSYFISRYQQIFLFMGGLLNESQADRFYYDFRRWPWKRGVRQARRFDYATKSKILFLGELAVEAPFSPEVKKKIISDLESQLFFRETIHFSRICRILARIAPGQQRIFDRILRALNFGIHWIKKEGLIAYAGASAVNDEKFNVEMSKLLYAEDNFIRTTAIEYFSSTRNFTDEITQRIADLYFLKESYNRVEAQSYFESLSKVLPERCIPFVERWLVNPDVISENPKEIQYVKLLIQLYAGVRLNIERYKSSEIENTILSIVGDDNTPLKIRNNIIRSFGKTALRNSAIIEKVKEVLLKNDMLKYPCFMYFRDLKIVDWDIIDEAIRCLDSEVADTQIRAMNYLAEIGPVVEINYNGKRTTLAEKIKDMYLKKDLDNTYYFYELEYLAKINFVDPELTRRLLEERLTLKPKIVFSDRDATMRYLFAVKDFSYPFFEAILKHQAIDQEIGTDSQVANIFFEHIERYVPDSHISLVKKELSSFTLKNIWTGYRLRKRLFKEKSSDLWTNQQVERFVRMSIALQKIILLEAERQRFNSLKFVV
jgi:hypothetical protein